MASLKQQFQMVRKNNFTLVAQNTATFAHTNGRQHGQRVQKRSGECPIVLDACSAMGRVQQHYGSGLRWRAAFQLRRHLTSYPFDELVLKPCNFQRGQSVDNAVLRVL